MNKKRLIDEIQAHCLINEKTDLTKGQIEAVLAAQASVVRSRIADGIRAQPVQLPGIGAFYNKRRAARTGRHPRTGEAMGIPEKWTVDFRPQKSLKDALNDALSD